MVSFSDPLAVMGGQVSLLPVGFELASYESIVSEPRFWTGYASTLRYTVSGRAGQRDDDDRLRLFALQEAAEGKGPS